MINGSADKRLSFVFLLLLTAAALYLSFLIARPFLTPIITATLLAVAVYPRLIERVFSIQPLFLLTLAALSTAIANTMAELLQPSLVAGGHARVAGLAPLVIRVPALVALLLVAVNYRTLPAVTLVITLNSVATTLAIYA